MSFLLFVITGALIFISLFIPWKWRTKRITISLFILVTAFACVIIAEKNNNFKKQTIISKAAVNLLNMRYNGFKEEEYIQAAFSFIEQNSDAFPVSYKRAVIIFRKFEDDPYHIPGNNKLFADEMDGLLKGIAILSQTEN